MSVTIKDIAKIAGVSHTTVSRALKNHPSISAETTSRIQALAQEMGYTPNTVAQSLLSRRTSTIGMVVTTIADPFMTMVVDGAEAVARQAGYSLFLGASHNDPSDELDVVETFHRRRVDAIIVTSSRVGSLYATELQKIKIPIVLINNQQDGEYLYSVAVDDIHGAQLAVDHLLSLGHRRIAYLGSMVRPEAHRRRHRGYIASLQQAGIEPDSRLIFSDLTGDDMTLAQQVLDELLAQNATAVFCYTDMVAVGMLIACRERGIAVPEQLSVAGFDDIDIAHFVSPQLTTVHQPRQQLGQLAMQMVLNLLNGKSAHNKTLPCKLVVRQSTATPA